MSDRPVLYSPLKQDRALCEQVVDYLTELIVTGQLVPGDFLPPETELCKKLNVSRTTMREAVRIIEARGFIARRHGLGIEVADRSREAAVSSIGLMVLRKQGSMRDLLEVRRALECEAAALAAVRATAEDREAMAAALEVMKRPSSTADEYVKADVDFHLRMAEGSKNRVLITFINAVSDLLQEGIRLTHDIEGRADRRLEIHLRLFDAISNRDRDGAREAMRTLLLDSEEEMKQLGLIDSAG